MTVLRIRAARATLPRMTRFFRLAALLFFTVSGAGAQAAGREKDLERLEKYLNGITTLTANFTQIAPDGGLAGGKFFLKRPGKMRWQYDPPTPVLMVASGSQMVYYDYELEQVSYIPLDSTLGAFLAREHIDLADKFVKIEDFKRSPGALRLTISQASKPEAGKLTLAFSDTPLQLRTLEVLDAQGQTTTVALNDAQFGAPLDDKLFVFQDNRKKRPKR